MLAEAWTVRRDPMGWTGSARLADGRWVSVTSWGLAEVVGALEAVVAALVLA